MIVFSSTAALIMTLLPVFLLSATGVLMRADLDFDVPQQGLTVALYWAAAAISSVLGGRIADLFGPRSILTSAVLLASSSVLLIGGRTRTWWQLLAIMAVAGSAYGLAQPAASLALYRGVAGTLGIRLGLQMGAAPAAGLMAGAALPGIGLTIGWRGAFLICAGLSPLVLVLVRMIPVAAVRQAPPARSWRTGSQVNQVALAACLGAACGMAMITFLVDGFADAGLDATTAGLTLAGGGAVGVGVRVLVGWMTDRWHRPGRAVVVMGLMLVGGSAGYASLATQATLLTIGGALVAFACGWGWQGLLFYIAAELSPAGQGAAAGVVSAGGAAGAALGPLAFGPLLSVLPFRTAWLAISLLSLCAAALVLDVRSVSGRRIGAVLRQRVDGDLQPREERE